MARVMGSSGGDSRLGVRARQALFIAVGAAVAAIMLVLGLWQMQRSIDSGEAGIAARAAEPVSPLLNHVHPDGTFDDIYGKPVSVSGRYLADQQLLVPASDGSWRVLTAFQVADGRVVPVVRGKATSLDAVAAAPAPAGERAESGIFLPGEADQTTPVGPGELASVRMPLLAQKWPQQVTPGFITLDAPASVAQGLGPASVVLPKGDKSLQNGSYALQWWVFAAFALGMGLKLAQGVGQKARKDALRASAPDADGATPDQAVSTQRRVASPSSEDA